MAGPGDEIAAGAAGPGHIRASHADREQAIGMLKAAFIQGRLDKDEFDLRVGQALASRTYADLAALTAVIPVGLTRAEPSEPGRKSASKEAVTAVASVSVAWTSIWVPLAVVDKTGSVANLVLVVVLISVVPALLAGYLLVHAWLDKRTGGQSLPGPPPGVGDQASRHQVAGGPAASPSSSAPHTSVMSTMPTRPVSPITGKCRKRLLAMTLAASRMLVAVLTTVGCAVMSS
jgi:Domain of unknown function (DUF1707)